ncbi:restriction endonuclease subunit S [Alcanivorax sp. DP30]|uniref:restriction endonuclease subunit S n=1 Tax=Alcanivorax sp. DP30 TaxID=2606217 RepID=UPI00136B647E|nr:restriction endonuclease subunit S [Alcanivorax sp. DP30]MZR62907.1 hypothetical protein [Alcanivorax sp. DP30]
MSSTVPEGWSAVSLGDLCTFSGGNAFKDKYQGVRSGQYPFIKVSDMNLEGNERFIIKASNWINEEIRSEAKVKLFPSKSVVFAKVGAALLLNRRRILTRQTAIDNNMMAAIPNSDDDNFLYYVLQDVDLGEIVQGGALPSVNQSQMKDIPALVPPFPEQQKIAAILSSVDDVIEKTRAQIDKLKDLKTGMMQELLAKGIGHAAFKDSPVGRIPEGWRVLRIGELLSERKQKGEDGLPIYSVLMDGGMVPRSTVERRVASELESSDNRLVRKGDLAYNMMRMWQGASGIAPTDCLVSPAYVVCYPSKDIDSDFLGYMLKMPSAIQMLRRYSQGLTSDRLRLYFEHFKFIGFAIPPVEEQRRIASILRAIDDDIAKKNAQLSGREALKKALMQDLLTGKVRVNVDNKENAVA